MGIVFLFGVGAMTDDWVAIAKAMCPLTPAANIELMVPLIEREMTARGMADEEMMLFAIATVRIETWGESFLGSDERPSKWSGKNFEEYDGRAQLGNTQPGDGARFRGRGPLQTTGRTNYELLRDDIGIDVVTHPERLNEPEIGAMSVASYIKRREKVIRQAMWDEREKIARKQVNAAALGFTEFDEAIERGYRVLEA